MAIVHLALFAKILDGTIVFNTDSFTHLLELVLADRLDIFDDGPLDTFFARRCGQGALVVPVAAKVDRLKEI